MAAKSRHAAANSSRSAIVAADAIESTFADAMIEAAEDGRLAAYWARPHVFAKSEPKNAVEWATPKGLREAWKEAARGSGPRAAMLEGVLRAVLAAADLDDDDPLWSLYRFARRLVRDTPALDTAVDPYPRARALTWPDWENGIREPAAALRLAGRRAGAEDRQRATSSGGDRKEDASSAVARREGKHAGASEHRARGGGRDARGRCLDEGAPEPFSA